MPVDARSLAAESPVSDFAAEIEQHRYAILEQLSRVLASPHFKHSRHYPALLRYVVEQTLDGHTANLKERSLGVDVFHRDPDYDTNLDPVVRTCACEVRKRIAHYYQEPIHQREIRIDLPAGSYHPEFHFPVTAPVAHVAPALALVKRANVPWPWWTLVAILLVPLVLAIGTMKISVSRNPIDEFWAPVFASADTALIAISHPTPHADTATSPTVSQVMHSDNVAFADALAMARVTGLIRSQGKRFDIRRPGSLTLNDLRKSPIILIGGFNNSWTMLLESHLRFYFDREPETGIPIIRDRRNPALFYSKGPDSIPYSKVKQDYAIVSRYLDPLTEKIVITVAGIGKDGTLAAGEFVTESKYLEALAAHAPRDWQHRNLQAVIATEIVNGIPGPPRILDQYFW
jgi:hypothetical protein